MNRVPDSLEDKATAFLVALLETLGRTQRSIEQCMRFGSTLCTVYQLPMDIATGATLRAAKELCLKQGDIYFEADKRFVPAAEFSSAHVEVYGAANDNREMPN